MDQWYAVAVRGNWERVVEEALLSRSIECFFPSFQERSRRHPGEMLRRPFFPSYVFARFDFFDSHARVRVISTPKVQRILGDLRGPTALSDIEVDSVRRVGELAASLKSKPLVISAAQYRLHDRVRVIAGPLIDTEGVVAYTKNGVRLVLTVEGLHRAVSVEVDAGDLERVQRIRKAA